jgi:hypothetical protein
MRARRLLFVCGGCLVAGALSFAQVGRGGSQWLAPLADAQRTSWVRSDDKISVESLAKPGFELQWRTALDNKPRGLHGLWQGVTAAGVTLFVPMSVVTGSSNTVYGIDNDIGYVVWRRHFDAPLTAGTPQCPGGIASGATRIVRLDGSVPPGFGGFGGASAGYRSLLGEPGEGVPVEGRGRGGARGGDPSPPPAARQGAPPAAGARQGAPGRGAAGAPPAPSAARIPGSPPVQEQGAFGFLFRPSGVVYVISSDGMLHVLGLSSGKDLQRPAPFLPPNSRWSSPVAVDTTLYAATSGGCGGAPSAVWAIDLDSDAKPVVSWKTNGGDVIGAVALASDGTLIATIGDGPTSGEGTANAIVALDPKTLQRKDWFSAPGTQFATGPTILRHKGKDVVVVATKDGRVLLLDATSLGGQSHGTPLFSSKPFVGVGAAISADALAVWQQPAPGAVPTAAAPTAAAPAAAAPIDADATSWVLLPLSGRPAASMPSTNGPLSSGAVMALKVADAGGALSLEPAWTSHDLSGAATPLVVNGVVFALSTGVPATPAGRGTPAILHAYDGVTGKGLWNSGKAMTTFASPGSLWTGLGQVYVGTHNGALYAFGFEDERRATTDR